MSRPPNNSNHGKEDLSTKVWVRTLTLEMASARLEEEFTSKCALDEAQRGWAWALARLLSGNIDGGPPRRADHDAVAGAVVKVEDASSIYDGQTIEIPPDLLFSRAADLDDQGGLKKSALAKFGAKKFGGSVATSPSALGTTKNEADATIPNLCMANPCDVVRSGGADDGASASVPQDLQSLTHLNEPSVLHILQRRYDEDSIYTSTGSQILLALNPFKATGLYEEETLGEYADLGEWEQNFGPVKQASDRSLPPHVFRIADNSFRSMMKALHADGMDHAGLGSYDPMGEDSTSVPRASLDKNDPNAKMSVIVNQSLLVSGESGSGKTVTTKHCLRYLASLSQRRGKASMPQSNLARTTNQTSLRNLVKAPSSRNMIHNGTSRRANVNRLSGFGTLGAVSETKADNARPSVDRQASWILGSEIEVKILEANPILEAFGNARTLRNDNSSRFGKYIELFFSQRGSLIGATIETYLLEKVRLIHCEKGERNYHIFYEIMDGATEHELKEYLLDGYDKEDFKIINQSDTMYRRDGVDDQEEFDSLIESFSLLQFDPDQIRDIMRISVACMHALNVTFTAPSADESDLDGTNPHLQKFLTLMGVERDELRDTVCFFEMLVGGRDKQRRNQSKANAEKGMEALIKSIYSALFTHLVNTINERIALRPDVSSKHAASIGILDIFGFESFQTNSLEQLMINYCNEALQQVFNGIVFKSIKEEYDSEGIDSSFISFPDNQDALDVIDKKGPSIFSVLDDMSFAPGANDEKFVSNLYQRIDPKSTRFVANSLHQGKRKFVIKHYAGPVQYSTEKWIEKNKDEVPKAMVKLLESSSNQFVNMLATVLDDQEEKNTPTARKRTKKTVAKQFSTQLKNLRTKIGTTNPYFVRCIKPNQELVADHFSHDVVLDQLKSLGVLEAVRVSRSGFSKSYSHEEFIQRYHVLAPGKELESTCSSSRCILIIDESMPMMMESFSKDEGTQGIQVGTRRVFLRQNQADELDRLRSEAMIDTAMTIQRGGRVWLARNELKRRRNAKFAVKIQAQVRRLIASRRVQDILTEIYSATIIQTNLRGFVHRRKYRRLLEAKRWAEREEEEHRRKEEEVAAAKRRAEEEEAAEKRKMEEEEATARRMAEKAGNANHDEPPEGAQKGYYSAITEEDIIVLKQKYVAIHGGTILPSLAESVVLNARNTSTKSNIRLSEQDSIGRDSTTSMLSAAPSRKKPTRLISRFFSKESSVFGRRTKSTKVSKRSTEQAATSTSTSAASSKQSEFYTVQLPVTQHGLLINITSLNGGAAFSSYRKNPYGDRGPAELQRLFRCRGDKIVSVNGDTCEGKSYTQIIDMLVTASQDPNNRICKLEMQDWRAVKN